MDARQEPGDVAHELVNLVSYLLALYFLNQEAHSLFWFLFYLNVHPLVTSFLDSLNNWYIRRSRERFWNEDQVAIDVLHTVLDNLCRVTAPLLPLLTHSTISKYAGT